MKLFCFPYAGGSAMIYKKWTRYLGREIELCPVELAGRGIRFKEVRITAFEDTIDDVYRQIKGQLKASFAFYGHSMGAVIAYELARKLKKEHQILPGHLFLSGRGAPHMEPNVRYSQMEKEELYEEIKKLGGTTEDFFEDEIIRETFMPILLDDFKMLESYQYKEEDSALECSFSILNGKQDHTLTSREIIGWKKLCKSHCAMHNFDGDHFFINSCTEAVVGHIKDVLFTRLSL